MSCSCRTDPRTGKTWTDTACPNHGVPSSSNDPLSESERRERDSK